MKQFGEFGLYTFSIGILFFFIVVVVVVAVDRFSRPFRCRCWSTNHFSRRELWLFLFFFFGLVEIFIRFLVLILYFGIRGASSASARLPVAYRHRLVLRSVLFVHVAVSTLVDKGIAVPILGLDGFHLLVFVFFFVLVLQVALCLFGFCSLFGVIGWFRVAAGRSDTFP